VRHATGAAPRLLAVKVYGNGTATWEKIVNVARAHAQRKSEAAERAALAGARRADAWRALASYMEGAERVHGLPAPTRRGSLDPTAFSHRNRVWEWHFTGREEDGLSAPLAFFVSMEIEGPDASEEIEPALVDAPGDRLVEVSLGFGRHRTGEQTITLREAVEVVKAQAVAAAALRTALAPAQPEVAPEIAHVDACGAAANG
jgi:hypothetical protein